MGQTLTNGIYLPAEGEIRCYDGLASNWTTLDSVVGGYRAHVANENIHITSEERSKWNTGVTQAYVLRYASVSLTALGTVAFSALDNTDNVKIGDKVLDSEGKLFALTAVDTANSTATLSALLIDLSKDSDLSNYYTKTETDTLLSYKATDSNVMHLSGNETAAGQKTFSGGMVLNNWLNFTNSSVTKGTIPQSTVNPYRIYFGSGVNYGASLFNIDTSVSNTGVQSFIFRSAENVVSGNDARFALIYDPNRTQPRYLSVKGGIEPNANNTYECGTNSNKWKSFNGINPGTLSLPNLSAGVDISGYITAGNSHNEYTPTVDGWISVILKSTSGATAVFIYQGDFANGYYGVTTLPNQSEPVAMSCLPVKAGTVVNIDIKGSNSYVYAAKFYPCQGNV